MRNAVDRAGRFLSLASLVSVLLCAIAVAMAARRYVNRHLDTVALLKTLGATRAFTLGAHRAAAGGARAAGRAGRRRAGLPRAGVAAAHHPRAARRHRVARAAAWLPIGIGFITALAVLAGFALPPVLQLSRVPALRVLRRDVGPPPPLVILAFGPAVLVVLLLVYWTVPEPKLFAYFTAGLAAFVLALTAAGLLLVYLAGRLRGRVGVAWRFGVANLSRRRAESVVQLVAFGTGIMVLLLLGILRVDLNGDWQRTLPQNLPNYFFVNIPPGAREEFVQFLNAQGARTTKVLPIIRGRLTAINGKPVEDPKTGRAGEEGFATREQNLTWSAELGADNRIIAGRWWEPADTGKPLVSLASEFQESLGVKVGDQLTFDIAGEIAQGDRGQHPQGEVGHLPAEFFHRVRARGARGGRRHVHDQRLFHPRHAGTHWRSWRTASPACRYSTSTSCSPRCGRCSTRPRWRCRACSCSPCLQA